MPALEVWGPRLVRALSSATQQATRKHVSPTAPGLEPSQIEGQCGPGLQTAAFSRCPHWAVLGTCSWRPCDLPRQGPQSCPGSLATPLPQSLPQAPPLAHPAGVGLQDRSVGTQDIRCVHIESSMNLGDRTLGLRPLQWARPAGLAAAAAAPVDRSGPVLLREAGAARPPPG